MTLDYVQLLKDYPKYMSLEQMRIVCHISKSTARRLLQTDLLPCINTGKKTHTYQIRKTDVIKYLKQRDIKPEKYKFGKDNYDAAFAKSMMNADDDKSISDSDNSLQHEDYPDVLSTKQAASLAGVGASAINDWVKKKYLISFRKNNALYIPKVSLAEYLEITSAQV